MFRSARLKLTTWYLLIIMLISFGFSGMIYRVLTAELDRFSRLQRLRIERRFGQEILRLQNYIDPDLAEETKWRLIVILLMINGGILFVSGGLAYFLAGKTLRPISQMLDEQNRFITDASHELKTPITSLKTALEVHLRDKNLNLGEAKKLFRENLEEVNKLQLLTERLLQLASFQSSPNLFRPESLSLNSIIRESVKRVKIKAAEKGVEIKTSDKDINFEGDKSQLTELLVILLDNAIKYSKAGGQVKVSAERCGRMISIAVADRGIGIGEKDLPHIFDRFYRADSARSKNGTGGYGLGLAIAKKIAENHHGTIVAESKIGKGSVFTVKLPIRQFSAG